MQELALKVFVLDDTDSISKLISDCAEKLGCNVFSMNESCVATKVIELFKPDVVFLDLCLPEVSGIEIIQSLSNSEFRPKLVLMSGMESKVLSSAVETAKSKKLEVEASLQKPFRLIDVRSIICKLKEEQASILAAQLEFIPDQFYEPPGLKVCYEPIVRLEKTRLEQKEHFRIQAWWETDDRSILSLEELQMFAGEVPIFCGLSNIITQKLKTDLGRCNSDYGERLNIHLGCFSNKLQETQYLEDLVNSLHYFDLPSSMFTIEIDEHCLAQDAESALYLLTSLRVQGFRTAVTTSGQPENVISRLKSIPIDELIVDMLLCDELSKQQQDSEKEFVLGSLVAYAAKENIEIAVKNVVTDSQFQLAKYCHVSRVSGEFVKPIMKMPKVPQMYDDLNLHEQLDYQKLTIGHTAP